VITINIDKKYFKVIVKANSSKTQITGIDEARNAFKLEVKAPAKDNKANKEIIKFFSKLLNKKVKIKSGVNSKEKLIEVI
jgi:uncharacterized protein (TIGR00251 family)